MQVIIRFESISHLGQLRWMRLGERLTLGTSGLADIVVEDESIFPFHLAMEFTETGCAILAAPGGFFYLNGQPQSSAWLRHEDHITVGQIRFRVEMSGTEHLTQENGAPSVSYTASHSINNTPTFHAQSFEHDSQFLRIEPYGDTPWTAADVVEAMTQFMPVYGLSRFDPWSFPCPESIVDKLASVPETPKPDDARFLPLLFPLSEVEDERALIRDGLNGGETMLLFSRSPFNEVLNFLREQSGLFLSPRAMQVVLAATENGAADAMLGPIDGIILGDATQWQLYLRKNSMDGLECALPLLPSDSSRLEV